MWSKEIIHKGFKTKSLVNDFHDKGWVHGDLRDANLTVGDKALGRVMLVDLDWGGNVDYGPVYYPTVFVNEELEKPGHPGDFRLTKEHDDRVLAFSLDKLEKKIIEVL